MWHKSVIIETTHGFINFPHLRMQVKRAATYISGIPQAVLPDFSLTILPRKPKKVKALVDHPLDCFTSRTVSPLVKITDTASWLISPSWSTIICQKTAVRVTNTTESPYLTKKDTQVAEFSIATSEQSKFSKLVDMTILSMFPDVAHDLFSNLHELLITNKSEQQNNTFWFPTPENLGKVLSQFKHEASQNY